MFSFDRVSFVAPTLGPTTQCVSLPGRLRGSPDRALTVERLNKLKTANRKVNHDIIPEPNLGGLATGVVALATGR